MRLFSTWIICLFYDNVDFVVTADNITPASPHASSQAALPKGELFLF